MRESAFNLIWFSNSIGWGYPVILVLFLLWLSAKGSWRNEMLNVLVTINTILFISAFIGIFALAKDLYEAYFSYKQYEWLAFSGSISNTHYVFMGLSLLAILLLIIPSFRRSWVYSFVLLLLFNLDNIRLWILRQYRDYMPSSWSVVYESYWTDRMIYATIFITSLILVYSILSLMNALPFPSLLLNIKRGSNNV